MKEDKELSLKDRYWETGNVFEFNNGEKMFVWEDKLIDNMGYLCKSDFDDDLKNTDSTVGKMVVRIYSKNEDVYCLKYLIKTDIKKMIWKRSDYIMTEKEVKEKLGIPVNAELIIIKYK